jgi:ferredoxin like protein
MKRKITEKISELNLDINIDNKLYLNRWKSDEDSHLGILDNTVCAKH